MNEGREGSEKADRGLRWRGVQVMREEMDKDESQRNKRTSYFTDKALNNNNDLSILIKIQHFYFC